MDSDKYYQIKSGVETLQREFTTLRADVRDNMKMISELRGAEFSIELREQRQINQRHSLQIAKLEAHLDALKEAAEREGININIDNVASGRDTHK